MKDTVFYPLGEVLELMQSAGMDVSYAYDDLVFSEHNVFVIRFDKDQPRKLDLFFNEACEPEVRVFTLNLLLSEVQQKKLLLEHKGTYFLNELPENEELEIIFRDL